MLNRKTTYLSFTAKIQTTQTKLLYDDAQVNIKGGQLRGGGGLRESVGMSYEILNSNC